MSLETLLEENLSDLDSLSQDKIHVIVQEALKTFLVLKEKSHSSDPKEREEAHKMAMSLKEAIQVQTEELTKSAGLDPAALASLAENSDLIAPEVWLVLSNAKKELEALQTTKPQRFTPHKRNKAAWLLG